MKECLTVDAGMTFLYYKDLDLATQFYNETLGLKLIQDQGHARIYQIQGNSFMGIVDGTCSKWPFCQVRDMNSVMLTLVVSHVEAWFDYLKSASIDLLTEVRKSESSIWSFLLKDPGGYAVEFQEFKDPELHRFFKEGQ